MDKAHVIYREATDDYLFRAVFSYDPEFPSTNIAFSLRDSTDTHRIGALRTHEAHALCDAALYSGGNGSPFVFFDAVPFDLSGNEFSAVVDHDTLRSLGLDENLFLYSVAVNRQGFGGQQFPYRVVALNVPEPSTLTLAMGTLLLAGFAKSRHCRFRRRPNQ